MKTSSAKQKGRLLQQLIAKKVQKVFNLQPDDVRSTPMGCSGSDIMMSPLAKSKFPFDVEAKNQEKVSIWKAYEQSAVRADPELTPLLIIKRNRTKPLVVLDFEDFMNLVGNKHENN